MKNKSWVPHSTFKIRLKIKKFWSRLKNTRLLIKLKCVFQHFFLCKGVSAQNVYACVSVLQCTFDQPTIVGSSKINNNVENAYVNSMWQPCCRLTWNLVWWLWRIWLQCVIRLPKKTYFFFFYLQQQFFQKIRVEEKQLRHGNVYVLIFKIFALALGMCKWQHSCAFLQ